MKTIFILTDFSDAARNAADYGVALAEHLGAELVLYHAYSTPVSIPDSYFEIHPEHIRKDAEAQLLQEVKRIRTTDEQAIAIFAEEGNTASAVMAKASAYPDCLLVSGMKKEDQLLRRIMGSTVTSLSGNGKLPLLVVPEGYTFKTPERIMFASDIKNDSSGHLLHWLHIIADRFTSQLTVVQVLTDEGADDLKNRGWEIRFSEDFSKLDTHLEFVHDHHVAHGLELFAAGKGMDMLFIMPHHHSFFYRLFHSSESKKMIFHSKIPLMLLPEKA
jgi:nucleotide-binding universal stress UspA family protein